MDSILPIIYHAWRGEAEYQSKIDELNHRPEITMSLLEFVCVGAPTALIGDANFTPLNAAHACISMIRTRIKNYYATESQSRFFPSQVTLWNTLCDMWKSPPLVQSIAVECLAYLTISDCHAFVPQHNDLPKRLVSASSSGNLNEFLFFLNVCKYALCPPEFGKRLCTPFILSICEATSNLWPKCVASLFSSSPASLAHTPIFSSRNGCPHDIRSLSLTQSQIVQNDAQGFQNGLYLSTACALLSIQRHIFTKFHGSPTQAEIWVGESGSVFDREGLMAALRMTSNDSQGVFDALKIALGLFEKELPAAESPNRLKVLDKMISALFKYILCFMMRVPDWMDANRAHQVLSLCDSAVSLLTVGKGVVTGMEFAVSANSVSAANMFPLSRNTCQVEPVKIKFFHLTLLVLKQLFTVDETSVTSHSISELITKSPTVTSSILSLCVSTSILSAETAIANHLASNFCHNARDCGSVMLECFKDDLHASSGNSFSVAAYHLLTSVAEIDPVAVGKIFRLGFAENKLASCNLVDGLISNPEIVLERIALWRAFEAVANVADLLGEAEDASDSSERTCSLVFSVIANDLEFALKLSMLAGANAEEAARASTLSGLLFFRVIPSASIFLSWQNEKKAILLFHCLLAGLASRLQGSELIAMRGEDALSSTNFPLVATCRGLSMGIPHLTRVLREVFAVPKNARAVDNEYLSCKRDAETLTSVMALVGASLLESSEPFMADECMMTVGLLVSLVGGCHLHDHALILIMQKVKNIVTNNLIRSDVFDACMTVLNGSLVPVVCATSSPPCTSCNPSNVVNELLALLDAYLSVSCPESHDADNVFVGGNGKGGVQLLAIALLSLLQPQQMNEKIGNSIVRLISLRRRDTNGDDDDFDADDDQYEGNVVTLLCGKLNLMSRLLSLLPASMTGQVTSIFDDLMDEVFDVSSRSSVVEEEGTTLNRVGVCLVSCLMSRLLKGGDVEESRQLLRRLSNSRLVGGLSSSSDEESSQGGDMSYMAMDDPVADFLWNLMASDCMKLTGTFDCGVIEVMSLSSLIALRCLTAPNKEELVNDLVEVTVKVARKKYEADSGSMINDDFNDGGGDSEDGSYAADDDQDTCEGGNGCGSHMSPEEVRSAWVEERGNIASLLMTSATNVEREAGVKCAIAALVIFDDHFKISRNQAETTSLRVTSHGQINLKDALANERVAFAASVDRILKMSGLSL